MSLVRSRWFVYGVAAIAVAAMFGLGGLLKDRDDGIDGALTLERTGDGSASRLGAPSIGGPFTLTAHTGEKMSDTDFRGRFMLIFFGYTYCPDVCPTSLQVSFDAIDRLEPETAARIAPIFITVDPERDTPEHLAGYVSLFSDNLIGMTGTPDEIATVAKSYRAYYAKVVEAKPDGEDAGDPDDYLVDHTAITYLMGPDGRFIQHFPHGYDPERMAARLAEKIAEWDAQQ